MRIIAGSLKGKRLGTPSWEGLRPTSNKLRETLFNVLAPRVPGARVLDGYAGTGAAGLEALSRGASHVAFVESDRRAQALIADNLAHCGVEDGYAIIRASFASGLERLCADAAFVPFDIVLLDPPYDQVSDETIAMLTGAGRLLAPDGIVVLEHAKRRSVPAAAGALVRARSLASGDSALTLYVRRAEGERPAPPSVRCSGMPI